jgi:hypothetical protein
LAKTSLSNMGKRIIDFDPEAFAFGDYLLFWDSSANGGLGGTRRGDVAELAGAMAGQGLQADAGKLGLGGIISAGSVVGIELEDSTFFQLYEQNYLLDVGFGFDGVEGYAYTQVGNSQDDSYIDVGSTSVQLQSRGTIVGSQARIAVRADGDVLLQPYNGVLQESSRVRAYAPIQYEEAFFNAMDDYDNVLATSGWVRTQLDNIDFSDIYVPSDMGIIVGQSLTENIAGNRTTYVTQSATENIGGNYTQYVGGNSSLQSTGIVTISSTSNGLNLEANSGYVRISSPEIRLETAYVFSRSANSGASTTTDYFGNPSSWLGGPDVWIPFYTPMGVKYVPLYD